MTTYDTVYESAQFADGCKDALEALVDKFNLARVLELLSEVAYAKAEHLESNWNDKHASHTWIAAGARVGNCAGRVRRGMEHHYGKMA